MDSDVAGSKKSGKKLQVPLWLENADESCGPMDCPNPPIVRVGEVQYTLCARLLDQGAQGIILPRVEDPEVLAEALGWLRFPPLGIRGFGINPTMVDYEARTMSEIIEHQNRETLSVG